MRVLVTGGSKGIGRATALRLAGPGAEIGVHYRTDAKGAGAVVEEIRERGGRAFLLPGDLAKSEDVARLAGEARARWPSMEGLVLCAGSYPRAPFASLEPSRFEGCFRENVFGSAELVRSLLPSLDEGRPGRVVFVSSILAFDGSGHGAHYAAAKAALLGLARSLARELAPRILVNVVAPGAIDTSILAGDTPERRTERNRRIPLGRIGQPAEVAEAIAFLLGPGASYVTGTTLHVNGGLRMG